ncbi:MAG: tetratricopeptide repeat protein [Spirochaetales bacterium]
MSIYDEINKIQPTLITLIVSGGVLIFSRIFRSSLGNLMEKLTKINVHRKQGNNETSLAFETGNDQKNNQISIANTSQEKDIEIPNLLDDQKQVEKISLIDLYIAIGKADYDKANTVYEELLSKETNEEKRFILKLNYFGIRLYHGQDSELKGINKLIEENLGNNSRICRIYNEISESYLHIENRELADEYAEKALALADNDELIVSSISKIVDSLKSIKKYDESITRIKSVIQKISDKKGLSNLYYKLYEILKEVNKDLAYCALIKSLEYFPNDSSRLFELGFEAKSDILCSYYYNILLRLDKKNSAAYNNLGVAYERLKLEISSIDCYKKAKELGETLAASNIALRLVNGGFKEEANTIIDWAITQKSVHQNVHNTRFNLEEKIKVEEEQKSKLEQNARMYSLFLQKNANIFLGINSISDVNGVYVEDEQGCKIEIEQSEKQIIIQYTKRGDLFIGKATDFEYINKIRIYKKTDSFVLEKYFDIYISPYQEYIELLVIDENDIEYLTMKRQKISA